MIPNEFLLQICTWYWSLDEMLWLTFSKDSFSPDSIMNQHCVCLFSSDKSIGTLHWVKPTKTYLFPSGTKVSRIIKPSPHTLEMFPLESVLYRRKCLQNKKWRKTRLQDYVFSPATALCVLPHRTKFFLALKNYCIVSSFLHLPSWKTVIKLH